MANSNGDNSDSVFSLIAYFAGVILIVVLFYKGCQTTTNAIHDNPDEALKWVFLIGIVSYIIHWIKKNIKS